MSRLTYKKQPAIASTRGFVPMAGTAYLYTVAGMLWPEQVQAFLRTLFVGRTLHVCCGRSRLGDVRLDADPANQPDLVGDAANMRSLVADASFETVLCDPPYNGTWDWNHGLLSELVRVATRRIIFQHWFVPVDRNGGYKKSREAWKLRRLYLWQPRTYFGRAQIVSVFDRLEASP